MTTHTHLRHATVTVSREIPASPEAVFDAYVDVDARTEWTAPPGDEVIYKSADFRVGGTDNYNCGPKGDPRFGGVVTYLDIAEATRMVFAETISLASDPISISQVTWEFTPSPNSGTHLKVTSQICSLVGDDMIDGTREGINYALDSLAERLADSHAQARP